jgi:F-type H+-transporting ATPase subunit b
MPQLDPSSYASQLFWLTISFVVLYVLLARCLLPRVQSVLTGRAEVISDDIAQAKSMKADAERAREHYEKALSHARARSQSLLAETQADIAARMQKQQSALDRDIKDKLAESGQKIASATRGVKDKLVPVAQEAASLIVEALVQQKPAAAEVNNVVGAIIKKQEV